MLVEPAPDPEEIFWRNVGLPAQSRKTGWALSMSATSVLCLFWSIPMAFFSSLTEVNSLKEKLPNLGELTVKYPSLEFFLALIAPLLLLTLNQLVLPGALKHFATWEGHVGASLLEASLFVKLCAFAVRIHNPSCT
jgi:membrane protease YdiL (CAAX protease family)